MVCSDESDTASASILVSTSVTVCSGLMVRFVKISALPIYFPSSSNFSRDFKRGSAESPLKTSVFAFSLIRPNFFAKSSYMVESLACADFIISLGVSSSSCISKSCLTVSRRAVMPFNISRLFFAFDFGKSTGCATPLSRKYAFPSEIK